MPRKARAVKLETRAARLKLPVAKKPIFTKIGPGLGLGYRRNTTAGTWVVRAADGKGGNWTKAIGTADDFDEADGKVVLDFWQAQDRARAIARVGRAGDGDDGRPVTIAKALDQYQADLKIRGGDAGNVARVRAHLADTLADKTVALVTARDLRSWRDGLAKELAPATVNRTANGLKAALNLAADHDERIPSRRAWETGLASIQDAEESRNVILPEEAIRTIIDRSNEQSAEFGLLVETAAVTGARISQLARLEVEDLQDARDDPRLMMPSSRKGRGEKKIARRPVPIPAGLAAKLRNVAKGRPTDAPLLIKPTNKLRNDTGEKNPAAPSLTRWKKSDHTRPFARAVKATGLNPDEVTLYALRHSSIVRQLLAGVPVRVVAVNHDTSVVMIERTYSRYIGDHADALARVALLDIAASPGGNVVQIAAAR
jgi:integrase